MTTTQSYPTVKPEPNDAPSTAVQLSDAELSRILGAAYEQRLSLQPASFRPELTALAKAVEETQTRDVEGVGKLVHRMRFERCKRAWDARVMDVDVDVTSGDLLDAAREIRKGKLAPKAGPSGSSNPADKPSSSMPTNTSIKATELNIQPGSREEDIEDELVEKFGRRNFRQYLNISPSDKYHGLLTVLANTMLDLEKKPAEIRQMLIEARDARLHKARNSKKTVSYHLLKETVTGTDVHDVTVVLQRLAAKEYKAIQDSKRKRVAEEDAGSTTPARKIKHPPGPGEASKSVFSSARKDKSSPRHSHRDVPPPPRTQPSTAGPTKVSTPPARTQARTQPISPPPVAGQPPDTPSTTQGSIPLSAMDELMLSSFQSLATHAPRALKEGQKMTLEIGRKQDGAYYFTHRVDSGER